MTRRRRWVGAGLVILCLVVYLPGFFAIPVVDRDEARFAQASRQMFESAALPAGAQDPARHDGGLLIPKVQDRLRLNKPPLIYWLEAASAALFTGGNPYHDSIWMYRVPSLLAAIVSVLATWRLGSSLFGAGTGRLGGALLAVCPVIAWESHQARADMTLLAWTTVAMWAMWEVSGAARQRDSETGSRWKWVLVFWVAMAGGVMTKGPITPMVALLAAVTYSVSARRWRWLIGLHAELGLPLVALAVAPWVWAVAQRVGADQYWRIVFDEVLGRSVKGKESHGAPPGYHLLLLTALLWPGSLAVAAGVVGAWRAVRASRTLDPKWSGVEVVGEGGGGAVRMDDRGRDAEASRFCLAWIIPAWIVFEAVTTKLPHYTLPLYPAVAILSARAVVAALPGAAGGEGRLGLAGRTLWLAVGAFAAFGSVGLAMLGLPMRSGFNAGMTAMLAVLAGILMLWYLRIAWNGLLNGRAGRALVAGVVVAVVASWVTLHLAAPVLLNVSRDLAGRISPLDPGGARPLAAVGYHEDSLIYWTRGRVERIEESQLDDWTKAHPEGVLLVQTPARPPASWRALDTVTGFNLSRGRRVEVTIAERAR